MNADLREKTLDLISGLLWPANVSAVHTGIVGLAMTNFLDSR